MNKLETRTEERGSVVMPIRIRRYKNKMFVGIMIPVDDPTLIIETRGLAIMAMAYKLMLDIRKLIKQTTNGR